MWYKIQGSDFVLKRNEEIRRAKGSIPAWIIAEKLGIHEKTLYAWLRARLSDNRKKTILKAIDDVKEELKHSNQ